MKKMPRQDRLAKIVRIDGRLHVIRAWHTETGYATEPLGDFLARRLTVEGIDGPVTIADALVEAGWTPPGDTLPNSRPTL